MQSLSAGLRVRLGDERGDDGVVGAFGRGEAVWVVGGEGETAAAVLEDEGGGAWDDAGAEAAEEGVDE